LKALLGGREDIKPIQSDLSDVDQLIIATPVWSQNLPPFTRQYLSGITNCSGKQFSVVIEMGKSGSEKVLKNIRRILEGKGMKFIADVTTLERTWMQRIILMPSKSLQGRSKVRTYQGDR